jgi:hypothetical protein
METMKSIVTDCTVPFRTREHQGALPTLAATRVPVQGTTVSAAATTQGAIAGVRLGADAAFNPTGDPSASFLASPL